MISLNTWQQALVDATEKELTWLFYIIDKNDNIYRWSNKAVGVILGVDWIGVDWDGVDWDDETSYEFKVISFSGITLQRPKTEYALIAPNDITLTISNSGHTLTPSDFIGGRIWASLYLDDGAVEGVVRRFRFNIKGVDPGPHSFSLIGEDFFQEITKGSYPGTGYARDVFPTTNIDNQSAVKVPIPFGICYVPLKYCSVPSAVSTTASTISFVAAIDNQRCEINDSAGGFGSISIGLYITITDSPNSENNGKFQVLPGSDSDTIYVSEASGIADEAAGSSITVSQTKGLYLLGPDTYTYDVTKVRRPRELGAKIEWTTGFNLYDIDGWTLLEPLIYDLNGDGVDDSPGFFRSGETVLDLPVQFSRSDTVGTTNPADVLEWVLKDFGALDDDINFESLATVEATTLARGLTFNGAFWYNQTKIKGLAKLLNMCHCSIFIDEQINVFPLGSGTVETIDTTNVIKPNDMSVGDFNYNNIVKDVTYDSGYISWQPDGEAQDKFLVYNVPVGATSDSVSDEVLEIPFVQDSQDVQRIGTLFYQRKLLEKANISFKGMSSLLRLIPDQFIEIDEDMFGGTYPALVDKIVLNEEGSLNFSATVYDSVLDSWSTITPTAVTPTDDSIANFFEPTVAGPKSSQRVGASSFEVWGNPNLVVGPNSIQAPYTSIQSAVNALQETRHSGIMILDGDYQLTSPIYLPDRNINIVGESQNVVIKNAEGQEAFILDEATSVYNFSLFAIESQNTGVATGFSKLIKLSGGALNTAIVGIKGLDIACTDLGYFSSIGDTGIWAESSGDLTIKDCIITDGAYGTHLYSGNTSVKNNKIVDSKYYGIKSSASGGTESVCNNNILSGVVNGIYFNSSASLHEITGNIIDLSAAEHTIFRGIEAVDNAKVNRNKISLNNILGDPNIQMITGYGDDINIVNNTIEVVCDSSNLFVAGCFLTGSKMFVSGNSIKLDNVDTTYNHIGVELVGVCTNNVMSGNTIDMVNDDAKDIGIKLWSNTQYTIGADNITNNVGTSIADLGTNNTVTATDI